MTLALGLLIVAIAVFSVLKRVDVRLALVLAGLAMGALAGDTSAIVRTFLTTLTREQFVVPICCAMGFAHVLRFTGCDQHLVHLLIRPLRRVRPALIPGAVLVGFLVNIPVISQTSTAVAVGPVLVPLLLAARITPITIGAALLLGSSVGGELLNPGAPELRTVSSALGIASPACVNSIFPFLMVQLAVATILFWLASVRAERIATQTIHQADMLMDLTTKPALDVSIFKAAVPLVPILILFLIGAPLHLIKVPRSWLTQELNQHVSVELMPGEAPAPKLLSRLQEAVDGSNFDSRLIGAAMLVGAIIALLTSWRTASGSVKSFFEGAGYAYTHIISLIVAANCFGEGVKQIGLAQLIGQGIEAYPAALWPAAGALPLAFAWVSGSGFAATQSLFQFFTEPSLSLGIDPVRVGAVVSIGSAAGRTMSPVAAVTLMCASLSGTTPLDLSRRVAGPLLAGVIAVVLAALLIARFV